MGTSDRDAEIRPVTGADVLLFFCVATPVLLVPLWMWQPLRAAATLFTPLAALPALAAALHGGTADGLLIAPLFTGLTYAVDPTGRAFLLLTALLWTAGAVYALAYIRHDSDRPVFFGFLLLAMAGNLGLTIAGDALSFYLHFALMTFAAYGLVVHDRTAEAVRAGRVYIAMAVLGEAALLAALMMLGHAGDTLRFASMPEAYIDLPNAGTIALLFAIGFAVKAGLAPLHLWLPLAHPVAPTPASALLSGAMIKAGLLGWLRFLPLGSAEMSGLGGAFIVVGVAGALVAAALAMTQPVAKTVLAYSSVSQMGYMAVAVGAALLVPEAAAVLVLAATLYALHHGLAKAALFLAVGVAPSGIGAKRRRWTLAVSAVPALALAGAPLTSGALAKGALTGGIINLPAPWPGALDTLLAVAAVGTTLVMARFLAVLRAPHEPHGARFALFGPWLALVAASAAAAFWLPLAARPPAGYELPGPLYGIGKSIWPVAIGVLLGAAVWHFRARLAYLHRVRVPAGDVVIAVEWLMTRLYLTRRPGVRRAREHVLSAGHRVGGALAGLVGRLAAREGALTSGAALGVLLSILSLLLVVALAI
jgi:hydrogenase-4 component B